MKISIAITTYNGERFLREQLDSLYTQSLLPDEIIVCDDCSSDHTIDILEDYKMRYSLQYFRNDFQLGVNRNFFQAISRCSGDYIFICDQDDVWMPHKIETLMNAIAAIDMKDKPVAVSSLRQDVDAMCKPIAPPQSFPEGETWEDTLLNTEQSQGCTLVMNRYLAELSVKYYNESSLADELMYDVLISLLAAIFGKKKNLSQPLMLYRHHDQNVVDRIRSGKKTFWQKVKDMPTYYPFLLDYRIRELAIMQEIVSKESLPTDIKAFLYDMRKLHRVDSIFKGLPIVFRLPQLSIGRKAKILILTPVVKVLKIMERRL